MIYNRLMKKEKNKTYSETVTWWDDIFPESYKVAIPAYGLTILKATKVDDASTQLMVSAPSAAVLKEFLEDHEEGDYRELDVISETCKTDEDYIKALKAKIA